LFCFDKKQKRSLRTAISQNKALRFICDSVRVCQLPGKRGVPGFNGFFALIYKNKFLMITCKEVFLQQPLSCSSGTLLCAWSCPDPDLVRNPDVFFINSGAAADPGINFLSC